MNLAILGSPESWYTRDLVRAAGNRHRLTALPFTSVRSWVDSATAGVASREHDLFEFDAVLVRTMPPGSLEQVVFRMDALHRLQAAGRLVVNSPQAIEVAVDKYLGLARLHAVGLLVPRTHVCQTVEDAMSAFEQLHSDVVVKPIFGSEGKGIARIDDAAVALRTFKLLVQLGAVIYLQEFIEHEGFDLRLLVVGNHVLGMRRRNPVDWRTNVSRGAVTEPLVPDEATASAARKAAQATGALLAGVDLLPSRDGRLFAIEVNAAPGWKALSETLRRDVAALVLDEIDRELRHAKASHAR